MFSVTIQTDNPAVLIAIAKAVQNTPPVGFQQVGGDEPTEVTINAVKEKVEEAKAALNLTPDASVKVDEVPAPESVPQSDEAEQERRRKILRGLIVKVAEADGYDVRKASDLAIEAAGVPNGAALADCPVEQFEKAVARLKEECRE